jgi:hypothetical protein
MANARFDIPTQLPVAVTRPLYAGVGATDRVVAVVREAVADAQRRAVAVRREVEALDYEPRALRRQATDVVVASVTGLQSEARELPARVQRLLDDQVSVAGDTYEDLVKRGERLVGRIRRQQATADTASAAKTTSAKAKSTKTQATAAARSAKETTGAATKKAAKKAAQSPARSSAKGTATSARKTARSATRAAVDAARKVGD